MLPTFYMAFHIIRILCLSLFFPLSLRLSYLLLAPSFSLSPSLSLWSLFSICWQGAFPKWFQYSHVKGDCKIKVGKPYFILSLERQPYRIGLNTWSFDTTALALCICKRSTGNFLFAPQHIFALEQIWQTNLFCCLCCWLVPTVPNLDPDLQFSKLTQK